MIIVNTGLNAAKVSLIEQSVSQLLLERKQLKTHRNATICKEQPWQTSDRSSELPNHKFLNMIQDEKCFLQYTGFESQNCNDVKDMRTNLVSGTGFLLKLPQHVFHRAPSIKL